MNNKTTNVRYLAQLALLAAIEVVMKLMGLGSVPVGPLYMSFLTVPIAVGAMTMGPTAGAILGGVFGLVSMKDAITGASVMTGAFFQISPINTFVLCVVMRVLMGWCVGLLFRVLRRVDHKKSWSYFVGAMSAPLLNTIFFMGYIVLLISAAAALGDAGSPASDTTLGPTSGLNADGQHDHIRDTCIPTFIAFNIPIMICAILMSQVL